MQADLALFTLDELRFSGAHDPLAALVLCGAHRADRVMVGGVWRVVDGAPVGVDLAGSAPSTAAPPCGSPDRAPAASSSAPSSLLISCLPTRLPPGLGKSPHRRLLGPDPGAEVIGA